MSTDHFNVADFGAVGDGVSDDTDAIQHAIDTAGSMLGGSRRACRVWLPRGVYVCRTLRLDRRNSLQLHVEGAGLQNTVLKLKDGHNAPLLDFGGPDAADGQNFIHLQDFFVDGNGANQRGTFPTLRFRRLDRSWLYRVQVNASRHDAFSFTGCSLAMVECEALAAGNDAVVIDACTSFQVIRGFFNNAASYGIRVRATNTGLNPPVPVAGTAVVDALIRENHIEQNHAGAILVEDCDNTRIQENQLQPYSGQTSPHLIEFAGGCRHSTVCFNHVVGSGIVKISTPGGGPPADFNFLTFGARTEDNWAYGNTLTDLKADPSTRSTRVAAHAFQILDLGRNYCTDQFRGFRGGQQVGGRFGGHQTAGWMRGEGLTNYALDSEDVTTASWTLGGTAGARSRVEAHDDPYSSTNGAAVNEVGTTETGSGFVQQRVAAPIAPGQLWTFSCYGRIPGWTPGAVHDYRLRILAGDGSVLADESFNFQDAWQRVAVSWLAASAYPEIVVQLYKYSTSGAQVLRCTWFQFNQGDLGPYFPTGNAPVTSRIGGIVAPGVTATRGQIVGIPQPARQIAYTAGEVGILWLTKSPVGVQQAPEGTIAIVPGGGSGATMFVKETGGTTSAGWVPK